MKNTYAHPETTFPPDKVLLTNSKMCVHSSAEHDTGPDDIPEDVEFCLEHGTLALYQHHVYSTLLGVWFAAYSGEN